MPDIRTTLTVQMQTKGAREASKIAESAVSTVERQTKGYANLKRGSKEAEREIARVRAQVEQLTRKQLTLNKAMEGIEKGSDAWKDLDTQLRTVQSDAERVQKVFDKLQQTFKGGRERREGFIQGLGQGLAPQMFGFLQRGPGMRQQMMGQFAGSQIRQTLGGTYQQGRAIGGSAAMTPFLGAQAVTQAVQSIPGIGGPMAATLSRAMQQAQQAVQYEQVRQANLPYLGGMGMARQMQRAGRRATAEARLTPEREQYFRQQRQATRRSAALAHKGLVEGAEIAKGGTPEPDLLIPMPKLLQSLVGKKQPGVEDPGFIARLVGGAVGGRRTGPASSPEARRKLIEDQIKTARRKELYRLRDQRSKEEQDLRTRAGAQARARVQRSWLGNIGGLGAQMGMALPEVRQFMGQVSQAGGGLGREFRSQRLLPAALGAKTMFGVQAPTIGAFLQGGRRGGLVGGEGRAGEALTEAIQDGLKIGLQGSEINDYLQQIASGINAWKQTGIPMNKESLSSMARTLGTMGLGGVRGTAVAGQFQQAAANIAQTGPQTVGQLMLLEHLGGIKMGEASAEDIENALIRLENKQFTGKDMKAAITAIATAGGGGTQAESRRALMGSLREMGVQMSWLELKGMTAPETMTPEQKAMRERIAKQQQAGAAQAEMIKTPEGMAQTAAGMVSGALKAQAAMTNKQIAAGYKMIGTMQNLERMAQRLTSMMAKHVGPVLGDLTGKLDALTKAVLANTERALIPNMQVGPT